MADTNTRIRSLEIEVEHLRRRLEQRPIISLYRSSYCYVSIDSGNTLAGTSQPGVKYVSGLIASVPSAYDPNVTSSFIDGIGRGVLYVNGIAQTGFVLVVNDDHGVNRNAILAGENPYAGDPVQIPVSGGGFISAYPVG